MKQKVATATLNSSNSNNNNNNNKIIKHNGYTVTSKSKETRQRLGYWHQFDVNFMKMKVTEHVQLYAAIKGVTKQFIDETVNKKLREVGLSEQDSNIVIGQIYQFDVLQLAIER